MSLVLAHLRYSARGFFRTPGIALALLFTIALGIGSTVAVQGFIRGLTKPALPLASIDRVVSVFGRDAYREAGPLSYEEYLSAKSRSDAFEWLGAAHVSQRAVTLPGQSATVPVARVTSDLASLFGLPLDDGVVISHRLWRGEFSAKPDVVGGRIQIDGVERSIRGVAAEWLEGLYRDHTVDVWMPLEDPTLSRLDGASRSLWVLGRLARGISTSQAQMRTQPDTGSRALCVLGYTGITPEMAAGQVRVGTLLRFAAGAVFFAACVNVALFLLGRAFKRGHETALRIALGGRRGQLLRELFSDSVVISIAGERPAYCWPRGRCAFFLRCSTRKMPRASYSSRTCGTRLRRPPYVSQSRLRAVFFRFSQCRMIGHLLSFGERLPGLRLRSGA